MIKLDFCYRQFHIFAEKGAALWFPYGVLPESLFTPEAMSFLVPHRSESPIRFTSTFRIIPVNMLSMPTVISSTATNAVPVASTYEV